jgi:hypothetical protein
LTVNKFGQNKQQNSFGIISVMSESNPNEKVPLESNSGEETKPIQIKPSSTIEETAAIKVARSTQDEAIAIPVNHNRIEETAQISLKTSSSEEPPLIDENHPLLVSKQKNKGVKKPRRWPWILLGLVLVFILGAAGAYIGYRAAIQTRLQNEAGQVTVAAVTQFDLAEADRQEGRFDMARQRYEYVIQLDPNFPGVVDKLAEVMLIIAQTTAPTAVPTATSIPMTPTPDLRGVEDMFNGVLAQLRASDWNGAINTIETLRKTDLTYRAVDVDGMYYIALRNRGMAKIVGGSLEGGLYDLALMERFGPIDHDADSYRTWARYYLTGASYWKVDWGKVVDIFAQIYPYLPNLMDSSGISAQERYRVACINYSIELAKAEDWCNAQYYMDQAFALGVDNAVVPTATYIALQCSPPTETPTVTPLATLTVTPTETPTLTTIETIDPVRMCCDPSYSGYNILDPSCTSVVCPAP